MLLISYLPKLTSLVWIYIGFSLFAVYLGGMLDLPTWVAKISPFGHIPAYPTEEISFLVLGVLTLIAVVLVGIGFKKYSNRESL